jgi:hypothetical protein
MSAHLSAYYLPVTQKTAEDFLSDGTVPDLLIERIGLFVMIMAGQSEGMIRANLSRALAELHDEFFDKPKDVVEACLQEACDEVKQQDAANIFSSLLDQGIRFAPKAQMDRRTWCGANGRYTEAFQDRCRDTLIDYEITIEPENADFDAEEEEWGEDGIPADRVRRRVTLRGPRDQARVAGAIAAASDEHFTLTAYAGTGKTHLLLALAQAGGHYTHLAPTAAHRQAFLQRVGAAGGMQSVTLYGLATTMANEFVRGRSTRWVNPPRVGDSTWSVTRQAEVIGVPSIAGETPAIALLTIYRIIRIWCFSEGNQINIEHARRAGHAGLLEDAAAYVEWANKVWAVMCAPVPAKQERALEFKLYHLVKWLDVSGADIPPMGTLLLDEAHDLPAPWYSLLRRYPQGWVTMGDPYQCLSGRVPQAPQAKALTMIQSVRAGEQAMPLFRSVIDQHSERLVDDTILGSRDHITRPRTYSPNDELPYVGLRVYGSVWKMLEDALRLKNVSGYFRLVQASEKVLVEAARDAILLRRNGDRPKSYQLRQFRSWDALAYHLESSGHASIARLFDRGFNENHVDELVKSQNEGGQVSLTLGLLEHCKNMEFSTVTMSSCCFSPPTNMHSRDERDKHIKAIYVAMTRVRDELWLPGDALDRLA